MAGYLYLRGTAYWGRVRIAGREYRRSLRTTDPREAARRLKAWRLKLERAEIGNPDAPTFKAAVLQWAAKVLPGAVKPAVAARYLSSIGQMVEVLGDLRVDQITSARIGDYINSRAGTVTNATIRRDLTALSRLLASCAAWGWITDNPARFFDRSIIRERREPIQPPDAADVAKVLAVAPAGMAAILRLLEATGMRENEAVTLERGDVDWKRHKITLVRTKTSRPRTLDWRTLGGDAEPALRLAASGDPMFRAASGGAYRNFSSNFNRVIGAVAAAEHLAGRPFRRFRVHDLRHGFAIRALQAGMPIYDLSKHLGHSSVKTTEGYLAYLSAQEQRDAAGAHLGAQRPETPTRKKPVSRAGQGR